MTDITRLALDVSTTKIGWSVWDVATRTPIARGSYVQDKKIKGHPERVHKTLVNFIKPLYLKYKPTSLILEQPIKGYVSNAATTINLSLHSGAIFGFLGGIEYKRFYAASTMRGVVFGEFQSRVRDEIKTKVIEWANYQWDFSDIEGNINGKLWYDKKDKNTHDDIADSLMIGCASFVLQDREEILSEYQEYRWHESDLLKERKRVEEKLKEYKALFNIRLISDFENVINDETINSKHPWYTRKRKMAEYFTVLKKIDTELPMVREKAKIMLENNQWLNSKKKGT